MSEHNCRFCGTNLQHTFCNLGVSPVSNAFIATDNANSMEPFYPLHVYVCEQCKLVQLPEVRSSEDNFGEDYVYFSSFSPAWLKHAAEYAEMIAAKLALSSESFVIEIASNDGYLLKNFVEKNIPVLGIEPTANTAQAAEKIGVPSLVEFFGDALAEKLANEGKKADLVLGNNVLAHVPDINDFVAGITQVLKDSGVVTMEFPHLLELMRNNQFDTIYHEHYSYLSLYSVQQIFAKQGLEIFDVEQLWTHGGSLRIYAHHANDRTHSVQPSIAALLQAEIDFGLASVTAYEGFEHNVQLVKRELLAFLIKAKEAGKTVAAYGAPAKGTTLLNYCGVGPEFIDYTVDRSPHKQGMLLPGVRIPVHDPDHIAKTQPDYLLILPWNLTDEIMEQMAHIRDWGGQFVIPIPKLDTRP